MATFEECLGELNEFQGFLEKQFNDALYATRVCPSADNENYYYDVAFKRDLQDEERELIGHEFKGIPITMRIISPGYIARKELN